MQNSITAKAQGNAHPLRLMPTEEKYTPITYTKVSELPKITEAHSPEKLSAPTFPNKLSRAAVEALPEKGRVRSRGKMSVGIPIVSARGASRREISATAPDALSMAMATIRAQSVGNSRTAVSSPSRAPWQKAAKSSQRE